MNNPEERDIFSSKKAKQIISNKKSSIIYSLPSHKITKLLETNIIPIVVKNAIQEQGYFWELWSQD